MEREQRLAERERSLTNLAAGTSKFSTIKFMYRMSITIKNE